MPTIPRFFEGERVCVIPSRPIEHSPEKVVEPLVLGTIERYDEGMGDDPPGRHMVLGDDGGKYAVYDDGTARFHGRVDERPIGLFGEGYEVSGKFILRRIDSKELEERFAQVLETELTSLKQNLKNPSQERRVAVLMTLRNLRAYLGE
jgi:hypothetical protein